MDIELKSNWWVIRDCQHSMQIRTKAEKLNLNHTTPVVIAMYHDSVFLN